MRINPRLNEIDDCLYRVAIRALIVQNGKVLMVQEIPDMWWWFPGGGVDHGETVQASLVREIGEELGVPADEVSSDFQIAYYHLGNVVKGIPRMNLFFKAAVPEESLKHTDHVATWKWFTKDEFMQLDSAPTYDMAGFAAVIFGG